MEGAVQTNNLGIADRLTRSKGRSSRNRMANARVTQDEQQELEQAAKAEGKALSEWAREVLLREARRTKDDALFTEVVAMRVLLNNVLRPLALGHRMTSESFNEVLAKVRTEKRIAAREVMQQYIKTEPKEQ